MEDKIIILREYQLPELVRRAEQNLICALPDWIYLVQYSDGSTEVKSMGKAESHDA